MRTGACDIAAWGRVKGLGAGAGPSVATCGRGGYVARDFHTPRPSGALPQRHVHGRGAPPSPAAACARPRPDTCADLGTPLDMPQGCRPLHFSYILFLTVMGNHRILTRSVNRTSASLALCRLKLWDEALVCFLFFLCLSTIRVHGVITSRPRKTISESDHTDESQW